VFESVRSVRLLQLEVIHDVGISIHAYIYKHRCTHLAPVQAERPSQVFSAPIAQVVEVIHDVGISIYTPIYTRL